MQKRYPNQTGKNLRYPSVENDLPPDIENKTSSGQNQGNLKDFALYKSNLHAGMIISKIYAAIKITFEYKHMLLISKKILFLEISQ